MSEFTPTDPIAVIDSGLGGLTVVKALRAALPDEQIVYFGDTARVPYGSKSKATVTEFTRQIIAYLSPRRPKHVVIACNTATALALPSLREAFPHLAITGVIEPGARAASEAAGPSLTPLIAIIATEATVRSRAYEQAIGRRRGKARMILRPTPLLVPLIEEGRDEDDPVVQLALEQYLQPLAERAPEVLVLGCTHYPLYKSLISKLMGETCRVIDSAEQCAQDVARRLGTRGLLCDSSGEEPLCSVPLGDTIFDARALTEVETAARGKLQCIVTDDSPRFRRLAERFLGEPVGQPMWIDPSRLAATRLTAGVNWSLRKAG